MTIYQEEMQRKAQRRGCDCYPHEEKGDLQICYHGRRIGEVAPKGNLLFPKPNDAETEALIDGLCEDANLVREYVGIYESAPPSPEMLRKVQSRTATYREIVADTMRSIKYRPFQMRLTQYLTESERSPMRYKNEKHHVRFIESIRKKNKKDVPLMAALYLLTSDLRLWNLAKSHVTRTGIDFDSIRLPNIHPNGYTIFCCAKDLYLGTKHLTIADLADSDLIPAKLFGLICNAMAICRYGLIVISEREADYD